jgi:hypothetical protein
VNRHCLDPSAGDNTPRSPPQNAEMATERCLGGRYTSRLIVTGSSVRCRAFDVIDHEHVDRTALRLEFQPELFLNRREQRRSFL